MVLFDPDSWSNNFSVNETTHWLCPRCLSGYLHSKKALINDRETADSRMNRNKIHNFPLEKLDCRFSGFLICNNSSCKESVATVGNIEVQSVSYYEKDNTPAEKYIDIYHPKFFEPTIQFFSIPEKCPQNATILIKRAFSNYWSDAPASVNNIRKALEVIMDDKGINSGRLHNRIMEFKRQEPEIGELLLALKWIGNTGSHSDNVKKKDVLKTFQVLHFSLIKIYDETETEINSFITQINSNKGL